MKEIVVPLSFWSELSVAPLTLFRKFEAGYKASACQQRELPFENRPKD
jgi:hypothetical protein